jgi:FAD/FMN-containing dehydrogenase
MPSLRSWGVNPANIQNVKVPHWRSSLTNFARGDSESTLLPFGRGRSYGDSCLNSSGTLLHTCQLRHIIDFDIDRGLINCESGISFSEILDVVIPRGWFLPVTPGTRHVTLGGAIANDVHGKNHHKSGSFGCFVSQFELWRSNGERIVCSHYENTDLFNATIGGLGLTGMITWAQFQLIKIESSEMSVLTTSFSGLEEFIELSRETSEKYSYSVAWLDCVASPTAQPKGLFYAANHRRIGDPDSNHLASTLASDLRSFRLSAPKLSVPFSVPRFILNNYSVRAFNSIYYRLGCRNTGLSLQPIEKYFYPLDGLENWNRIYGGQGFIQYQFVVPLKRKQLLSQILSMISSSGSASFLTVLKEFGSIESPGLLSFPREGLCLALDFTNQTSRTLKLLDTIDGLLVEAGGAVYPAKDRRMSRQSFKAFYPKLDQFTEYVDPAFSSDFWRRVSGR